MSHSQDDEDDQKLSNVPSNHEKESNSIDNANLNRFLGNIEESDDDYDEELPNHHPSLQ